jgi:hypothetical protein
MTRQDTAGIDSPALSESLFATTGEIVWLRAKADDSREVDLERINPFSFYDFGKEINAVLSLSGETVPTRDAFWPLWRARNVIQKLIAGDPIPIGISATKAKEILDRINYIMDDRFQTKNEKGEPQLRFPEDNDPPIAAWAINWIRTTISEFETVFAEEMRETATYFVPRRGIYYTPALVDSAEQTFPKDLLPFIPDKAKADWKAAGRCLAFNLLSASGFHVARAVEACLESYYGLFSGKPGDTLRSWYDYIKALKGIAEKKPTPCPLEKTLVELDQMREDYRNPIVHPRVVLSEGDARMLFANGESLIIAMAQELAAAAKGVQPSLALVGGKDAKEEGNVG